MRAMDEPVWNGLVETAKASHTASIAEGYRTAFAVADRLRRVDDR
jgi:hypothetical protein